MKHRKERAGTLRQNVKTWRFNSNFFDGYSKTFKQFDKLSGFSAKVAHKSLETVEAIINFTKPMRKAFAAEQGLNRKDTNALISEYGKYIYLMQFSKVALLPSREVEQVQHFHMQSTSSYNHRVELIFGESYSRFQNIEDSLSPMKLYECTLHLYERKLGIQADPKFWPPPSTRFTD